MRVASRVAERLKTSEDPKSSDNYVLAPSLHPKMKLLLIQPKNCSKNEIEIFPWCTISH